MNEFYLSYFILEQKREKGVKHQMVIYPTVFVSVWHFDILLELVVLMSPLFMASLVMTFIIASGEWLTQ